MSIKSHEPIDFIMIWVDGNDPEWRAEKAQYDGKKVTAANSEVRFRDWDNLQYWFRSVERYAPWVNKIHFVTWGHLPPWLDTSNPKINVVKHTDYIPEEYLPTFSSHTIELNLHRIEGLAEQFVYFNDDMFITAPVEPEDFFKNGKPCDTPALDCIFFGKDSAGPFNGADITVINSHFKKKQVLKRDFKKWYNLKNGFRNVVKSVLLYPWPWFPGLYYQHACNSFLKSTFEKVWAEEFEILDETCSHRFRKNGDVNQWVMKFWQQAEGNFEVRPEKFAYCYHVKESNFRALCEEIPACKRGMLCINDTAKTKNFEDKKAKLIQVFNSVFPEISEYEKPEYYDNISSHSDAFEQDPAAMRQQRHRLALLSSTDFFEEQIAFAASLKSGKLSSSRQLFVLKNILNTVKISEPLIELLTAEEANRFFAALKQTLTLIDEETVNLLDTTYYYKFFITQLKTNAAPRIIEDEQDTYMGYSELNRYSLTQGNLGLQNISVDNEVLTIEGCYSGYTSLPEEAEIKVYINGEYTAVEKTEKNELKTALGIELQKKLGFNVKIPLEYVNKGRVVFVLALGDKELPLGTPEFGRRAALNNDLDRSYFCKEGFKLTCRKGALVLSRSGIMGRMWSEIKFLLQILKRGKAGSKKAILVRLTLPVVRLFRRRPIWVVDTDIDSDTVTLFERLKSACPDKEIYLVLPEGAKGNSELGDERHLLFRESRKYKSMLLTAQCIFTEMSEDKGYNPFRKRYGFYKDILNTVKIVNLLDFEESEEGVDPFEAILESVDSSISAEMTEIDGFFEE